MRVLGLRARAAFVLLTAGALASCAEFADWDLFERDPAREQALAQAEAASLWEMTLMAGRYGVMLGQAREILNLPEPKAAGEGFPTGDVDVAKQRVALAQYQASVAAEFVADVARACKRKRVPKKVRTLACEQAKMPDELQTPVEPDMQALAVRNDRVGDFVMTWWNEVCAVAPKPKSDDDVPPCAME
jgi:hypothetical protein